MARSGSAGRRGTLTSLVALTLGLYVALLAAAPLEHHDLACHLKSPTHCTTCVFASAPGHEARQSIRATVMPVVAWLAADAGATAVAGIDSTWAGRAPPTR